MTASCWRMPIICSVRVRGTSLGRQCNDCIAPDRPRAYPKSRAEGAPMQLSRVDLNLFTIFDAIYRDGGITPASKRLHLSQPAVSHALARLRELLDDPLFERRGHDMVPTPLARSIAANVASSLGGLEQLLQRTGRFEPATSQRSFTVAMRQFNELPFLPMLIERLQREAPHVDVAVVRIDRRDLEQDLQSGGIDLA